MDLKRMEPVRVSEVTAPSRLEEVRLWEKTCFWQKGPIPKGAFVLIGAPDDRGVMIAGGRTGARKGPTAIRKELYRLTTGAGGEFEKIKLFDVGNIRCAWNQQETYDDLARAVEAILRAGCFPILLGGGHDLSFGSLKGFLNVYPDGGVVNIDPHFDCRPKEKDGRCSSGVVFRLLLEEGRLKEKKLACFGYQTERNSKTHFLYLKKKGADLVSREKASLANFKKSLARVAKNSKGIALSFDMDCVESASAPGVSALNPIGFSVPETLAFIQTAAKNKKIKSFDLMEVNPAVDPDGRTARLAALLIVHFILARKKS